MRPRAVSGEDPFPGHWNVLETEGIRRSPQQNSPPRRRLGGRNIRGAGYELPIARLKQARERDEKKLKLWWEPR